MVTFIVIYLVTTTGPTTKSETDKFVFFFVNFCLISTDNAWAWYKQIVKNKRRFCMVVKVLKSNQGRKQELSIVLFDILGRRGGGGRNSPENYSFNF